MNSTDAKVEGILRMSPADVLPTSAPGTLKVSPPTVRIEGGKDAAPKLRLRDNALDGFRFGALFDWRVRLAAQLLEHSPAIAHVADQSIGAVTSPAYAAKMLALLALDTATALVDLAEERGLIEEFGKPEAQQDLRDHVKRQARYQVAFQIAQQVEAQAQAPQVQAPGGSRFPGN